ncbi:MAG: Gfo/Idh/MocA family oxidoreductase [Candidatus Poribacteria bacterium]|nr:Gfo/Idh/MocA family oxidoreductase [Candidatus Poribacteria bacterium]
MKPLRIAVIGAGAYESSRSRAYQATITKLTDLYTLCAICDRNAEACRAAAEVYGIPAQYTDVEEMLHAEKPDVVFCLTPTDSLNVMAMTVAQHKINVITEIPIAISLPIADAITQTARKNGVKYEIAENVWLWPHERLKQKIVQSGLLGKIRHARLWYASGSYHGFNAIRMILGCEPVRVLGYADEVPTQPYTGYGGEAMTSRWWESGMIEFPEGLICLYEMPPPGARGSHWEIEGTAGYLSGDELVLYKDGEQERYQIEDVHTEIDGERVLDHVRVDTSPPIVWSNPFAKYKVSAADDVAKASILQSMYCAVTENIEPVYGPTNARRDLELWVAVRESAHRGNVWVDLPITEMTALERQLHEAYTQKYGADPTSGIETLKNAPFDRSSVVWAVAGWL